MEPTTPGRATVGVPSAHHGTILDPRRRVPPRPEAPQRWLRRGPPEKSWENSHIMLPKALPFFRNPPEGVFLIKVLFRVGGGASTRSLRACRGVRAGLRVPPPAGLAPGVLRLASPACRLHREPISHYIRPAPAASTAPPSLSPAPGRRPHQAQAPALWLCGATASARPWRGSAAPAAYELAKSRSRNALIIGTLFDDYRRTPESVPHPSTEFNVN